MTQPDDPSLDQGIRRGLRMTRPPDPAKLAAEKAVLADLENKGFCARNAGYFKFIGPGYMQSAMTLGGGTAAASLFAGAAFGYKLLWVAPLAIIMGVVMLTAVSHQTLSTGMRPFDAMRRYAGAPLAWAWAIGALLASIIWHFPQYSLASACLVDIGATFGVEGLSPQWLGVVVLIWAIIFSMLYGASPRWTRLYEHLLKYMVWFIIACFGYVVFKTGIRDWGELARGFFAFEIPQTRNEVKAVTIILGGLSAAVGVNMLFIYPYSLLARGWGREHRRLARFDLYMGMIVPYILATSLMLIATANTLNLDPAFNLSKLAPVQAAESLSSVIGQPWGRLIFDLGVLGMALSTITLHMLVTGFVCIELFDWRVGSWKYRLATLLPAPGVLGPILWSKHAVWLAVPTSVICGFMVPAAYLGFILLQGRGDYLGKDKVRGVKGALWLGAMCAVTLFMTGYMSWYVYKEGPSWWEKWSNMFAG